MIDLQNSCGLPLSFDEMSEKFRYGEGVVYQSINRIPLSSMLPGLLNKSLRYPKIVYVEHRNIHHREHETIFSSSEYNFDVLMIPSGLMGVEFIRTHIFFSEPNPQSTGISEIVESLSGALTILLQKNAPKDEWDFGTRVSEGLVVKLDQGEKFVIPRGYYYTFINTKGQPVIFSRFYQDECLCDYSKFQREQGLAYFAIRKNAKQEIVLNPRYRDIPKIKKTTIDMISCSTSPDLSTEPLYTQVINRGNEFKQYFF